MLYAILLLYRGWKEEKISDQIVGTLVFLFAFQATSWMLGFAGYYDQSAKTIFMFYCPWRHAFIYGPLVYLFFRSLTDQNFKLWKRPNWYHLLPGLLLLCLELITIGYDFLVVKVHTLNINANNLSEISGLALNVFPNWVDTPLQILELVSQLGYFIYTLILYKQYRSYLKSSLSNDELVHLKWLRNFLVFFLVLIIGTNVIDILSDSFQGLSNYEVNWWGFLLYGLLAYYLGFQAYGNNPEAYRKIDFKFSNLSLTNTEGALQNSTTITSTQSKTTQADNTLKSLSSFQQIEQFLDTTPLYLEPTLSLQELANAVGLSTTEVSNAINRAADTNFNYYINTKRVQVVKEKLIDPAFSHLSLLGIGLDAGFSSKATFNRAFKLHTGLTPRQFQKSQILE